MRRKTHHLQYLEALRQRSRLTPEEEQEYRRPLKGYEGEVEFDRFCDIFLNEKIPFLNDVDLCVNQSDTQIDKMILQGGLLCLVDIKNWQGNYRFENNNWSINGKIISGNICEQLNRSVGITQQGFNQAGISVKVIGVLAFIHSNAQIELVDPISTTVLMYNEIPKWLKSLRPQAYDLRWENVIRHFQVSAYRQCRTTSLERFNSLAKGIVCPHCGCLKAKKQERQKLICPSCGYVETKKVAFKRTICECGLIMHHQPLIKKMITQFIGEGYSQRYVTHILQESFELIPNTKFYQNKGVSYEEWF